MLWKLVFFSLILQVGKATCPRDCICNRQTIDCSSRRLTAVPSDLPSEVLYVGTPDNPLQPDETTKFTSLNLANNQLESLPTSLLSESLPNLQKLDLSNNKIVNVVDIQSVVLSKQLFYFNLSSNPIRNLGVNLDTVLYSPSVSHLDVSECTIHSITNPATFMYMLNLTSLDLSGNPLIVIDHLVSSTLRSLDLSHCLLGLNDKSLREETFSNSLKLEFLNLSLNAHLTRFPLSTLLSSSLFYLEASYCALDKMDLTCFPNLKEATLKGNVIKNLQNNMLSNNIHLEMLDISENSITNIEQDAFVGANSLRKLDLSLNLLTDLDWNAFLQTPRLETLNISRNFLTSLEAIPVPSLVNLDASKCDILKLNPMSFAMTQNLQVLNLSHNSIERLPRRLKSTKLLSLDLSFCRLSDLQEETFHGLSSLINLNLMGNRLTSPLKESLLDHLVNMKELNLLNNPWHCDCNDPEFRKLWKHLMSYSMKAKYLANLNCHSPKDHSGMSWEKGCFENFTDSEKAIQRKGAWFSFLVPFLTLCCLLAILVVIRQAYTSQALERQQRANTNSQGTLFLPRIPPHFFDEDLERGIHLSVNESSQRSPVRELSKLPSYEEALLLPKLQNREDLNSIVKKYEDSERFERSTSENAEISQTDSNSHLHEDSLNRPSTSGQ